MDEVSDKVGLGVDLIGGAETLTTLRAIRQEMVAIAQLGGRGPGGSGGGGTTRIANFRTEDRVITDAEIRSGVARRQRAAEVNRLIQTEELAHQRKMTQIRQDGLAQAVRERQQAISRGRATPGFGSQADLTQNQQQRALFQRYRNDPARDAQTNQYRRDIANETVALRTILRERNQLAQLYTEFGRQSQNIVNARRNLALLEESKRRVIVPGTDFQTSGRLRGQLERGFDFTPPTQTYFRQRPSTGEGADAELAQLRAAAVYTRRSKADAASAASAGSGDAEEKAELIAFMQAGGDYKKFVSSKELKEREANRLRGLVDRQRQARSDKAYVNSILGPPGKGGGGSGGGGEGGEGGGPAKSGGGFEFGVVGRIARNYLLYRGLHELTFGLYEYTKSSLEAAKATTEQGLALKFATEAAGGNLEANRALSVQLQQFGYNKAQAAQVVAAGARATFRHPELASAFTQEATNIAALRGGGLQETTRVIEDLIGGRDRAYREYFNITPETIYKDAAKKRLAQNAPLTGFRGTGSQSNDRYESDSQKINRYVAALSEEEKETLRLNYILSQSGRFQGDAAERAGTLAGKMDLVSAAFFNASANVGAFVADIRPVKELLDSIAGATPDSVFSPPVLHQTGPQNLITDSDIVRFASDASTGKRARTLDFVSKITSFLANTITPVNTITAAYRGGKDAGNSLVNGPPPTEAEYNAIVAENQARLRQVNQRNALRAEGRLAYRRLTPGDTPGTYYNYSDLNNVSNKDFATQYVEDIKPKLDDAAESLRTFREERQKLLDSGNVTGANRLEAERFADFIGKFRPDDYLGEAAKREDTRKAKELEDRNRRLSELGNALSKLRDAEQGAFRLPGDIGTSIAGQDNPYVKVLADQITAAERMRQQWGFLGQSAVDYFTKIEQGATKRELNKLEFQTYTAASNLRNQADREALDRSGPGLSRREQSYLDVQSAIVERAIEIPKLWAQAASVLGRRINPLVSLRGRFAALETATGIGATEQGPYGRIEGFSENDYLTYARKASELTRQSPQVRAKIQEQYAEAALGIFSEFDPQQIRRAGLAPAYLQALNFKAQGLDQRVAEAQQKAQIGAIEDARLQTQLEADDRFRRAQLAKGYDAGDVGRASDSLLLSRTEGIAPKDLSYQQFASRQEALRRQADRQEQDRQEAQAAVQEGLRYQAALFELVSDIRQAILGGDMSLLVQVQNDAQARLDQSNLQELGTGRYNVPLDQGESKTSPYTNSFTRYKRGGRK